MILPCDYLIGVLEEASLHDQVAVLLFPEALLQNTQIWGTFISQAKGGLTDDI